MLALIDNIKKYCKPHILTNKELNRKTNIIFSIHLMIICIAILKSLLGNLGIVENNFPSFITVVFSCTSLFIFVYFGSFIFTGNFFAFCAYSTFLALSIDVGGVYSDDISWLLLVPFLAVLMANFKSGVFWLVTICLTVLGFYYVEITGEQSRYHEISDFDSWFYFQNWTFFFCCIAATIYSFRKETDLLIGDMNEQQELLLEQKKQISDQAKALNQTKEVLLKQNKELEQFSLAVSQDLKEPLEYVELSSRLLENYMTGNDKKDERTIEFFDFIKNGNTNMKQLITDLHRFAYFTSNEEYDYEYSSLNTVLDQCIKGLHNHIEESSTQINIMQLPSLDIIPIRISQLFQNILSNAIKFRKKDEPLSIDISAKEHIHCWEIAIRDNGIGIEAKNLEDIFKPFRKLHSQKEYTGSGIGLATCKKIVNLHKGDIWVESVFGEGTTFKFTLLKDINNDAPEMILGKVN